MRDWINAYFNLSNRNLQYDMLLEGFDEEYASKCSTVMILMMISDARVSSELIWELGSKV